MFLDFFRKNTILKEGKFTRCRNCKNKILISEIKLDKNGKQYLCKECYDLLDVNENASIKKNSIKKISWDVGYVCVRCKYKFRRSDSYNIKRKCPSCGREGTVERVKTADEIIKESENFF